MSIQLGKLCSELLRRTFGVTVQSVADCLFTAISRSLPGIVKYTKLKPSVVSAALTVLIKFQIVSVVIYPEYPNTVEFKLVEDNIILLLRYPQYIEFINKRLGNEARAIIEELLSRGSDTASNLLLKSAINLDVDETINTGQLLAQLRDILAQLMELNYIIRIQMSPLQKGDMVPSLTVDHQNLFKSPEIDIPEILRIQNGEKFQTKDSDILLTINLNKFHQEFRDALLVSAIEKRIDANAGQCLQFIFDLMYATTEAWQPYSNPLTFNAIRDKIEKSSSNLALIKDLQQYMLLIAEDKLHILSKTDDASGGTYIVNTKMGIEEICKIAIENVITEKFGSKSSRIYRVIQLKKYIEENEIQKEAMIPRKEAKALTYQLFEEQMIHMKTIGRSATDRLSKCYTLFCINHLQVVAQHLELCYKGLYNLLIRSDFETSTHKHLIDKSSRLDGLIHALRAEGHSEETLAEYYQTITPSERDILDKVKIKIKNLYSAESSLQHTIFMFNLFIFYNRSSS